MPKPHRTRSTADVAIGYAADDRGDGLLYANIHDGATVAVVRLTFFAPRLPALDGRECGYAATAAIGAYLKARGFTRVRIRLADAHVAAELGGLRTPPRALAMAYVKGRCLLHGLGSVRLEFAESLDVRDLTARAQAEVRLRAAA